MANAGHKGRLEPAEGESPWNSALLKNQRINCCRVHPLGLLTGVCPSALPVVPDTDIAALWHSIGQAQYRTDNQDTDRLPEQATGADAHFAVR